MVSVASEQIGLLLELADTSLFDCLRKYPVSAFEGNGAQAARHAQVMTVRWQMCPLQGAVAHARKGHSPWRLQSIQLPTASQTACSEVG